MLLIVEFKGRQSLRNAVGWWAPPPGWRFYRNLDALQEFQIRYEDELKRALAEDGSSTSTYITPESYYPSG